jgi:hypothetical protein
VSLLPFGLMSGVYNAAFLVYFRLFSYVIRHVLLQMNNHQNLWN